MTQQPPAVTAGCRWHLHTIHDGGVPVEFLQALAGFGVLDSAELGLVKGAVWVPRGAAK